MDFPTLSLEHGALLGNGADGQEAIDSPVSSGEEVSFIVTGLDPPKPAQIYCGIVSLEDRSIKDELK